MVRRCDESPVDRYKRLWVGGGGSAGAHGQMDQAPEEVL